MIRDEANYATLQPNSRTLGLSSRYLTKLMLYNDSIKKRSDDNASGTSAQPRVRQGYVRPHDILQR